MNQRATGWNRQEEISTILNSPMTIRPLTSYESESNRVEQTGRDQHHSEFPNDNQTTYLLWIREQQGGTDRQRSAPFWIPQWQSDHLQAINQRATGWNSQAEISTILNSPMTVRPLTSYESESNRVEQTGRDQHHSESTVTIRPLTSYESESNRMEQTGKDQHHSQFSNDNQTTYSL